MKSELIDPIKVRKDMDAMIDMITHPAFVAAMQLMKQTPVAERREIGKRNLTVDALRAQGVLMPAGMRITTRYFEPDRPDFLVITHDGKVYNSEPSNFSLEDSMNKSESSSFGTCACGGNGSICGGAGV